MSILINLLLVCHAIVSILIVLITLMQRPKNEGLGAAFGGGVTADLFGAQTSNVLATITRWLGGLFFGLTIILSVLYARVSVNNQSDVMKRLRSAPKVSAAPTPALSGSVSKVTPLKSPVTKDGKPAAAAPKSEPVPVILDTTKPAKSETSTAPTIPPVHVKLGPDAAATPALALPVAPLSTPAAGLTPSVAPSATAPSAPAAAATPATTAATPAPTVASTPAPTAAPTAAPTVSGSAH